METLIPAFLRRQRNQRRLTLDPDGQSKFHHPWPPQIPHLPSACMAANTDCRLQVIRASPRASPHAKIRRQAGSYKGTLHLVFAFEFVGAGLPAIRACQRASPHASIRRQAGSDSRLSQVFMAKALTTALVHDFCESRAGAPGFDTKWRKLLIRIGRS